MNELFKEPVTIFWDFEFMVWYWCDYRLFRDLIRRSDWNLETLIYVNERALSSFISVTKEVNTVIWIFPVLSDNLAVLNVNVGSLVEDSIGIKL